MTVYYWLGRIMASLFLMAFLSIPIFGFGWIAIVYVNNKDIAWAMAIVLWSLWGLFLFIGVSKGYWNEIKIRRRVKKEN